MGKVIPFPRARRVRPTARVVFAAFGELESHERAQARLAGACAAASLLILLALQLFS